MSLEDELTEIHGVGDSKAEEIMEVLEEYESDPEPSETFDMDAFEDGMSYLENGDYEYALKFFRRVRVME